ncbi:MAG: hypothetical protein ACP5PJ_09735 [Acidimicrobiales bacterium]
MSEVTAHLGAPSRFFPALRALRTGLFASSILYIAGLVVLVVGFLGTPSFTVVVALAIVLLCGVVLIARQRQSDKRQLEEAFPATTTACEPSEHCGNASCATEGGSCAARLERALADRLIEAECARLRGATSSHALVQFAILVPWPIVAMIAAWTHGVSPFVGIGSLCLELAGLAGLFWCRNYARSLARAGLPGRSSVGDW